MPAAIKIRITSVTATGQENLPEVSEFDIGHWAFSVLFKSPKKVPPPTPDGREGRLFPPEQSSKAVVLVAELYRCRNKKFP
jgi:hypothetical protein